LPTPFFFGIDGAQIAGTVNQDVLAVRRTQDVLLLHHHNAVSAQAEVVTLRSGRSTPLAPIATPALPSPTLLPALPSPTLLPLTAEDHRVYLPIITTP
jgi:hypothetical protein